MNGVFHCHKHASHAVLNVVFSGAPWKKYLHHFETTPCDSVRDHQVRQNQTKAFVKAKRHVDASTACLSSRPLWLCVPTVITGMLLIWNGKPILSQSAVFFCELY